MKNVVDAFPTALELQLQDVIRHHNLGKVIAYEPITHGLVNTTWRCDTSAQRLIVQRLSSKTPPDSINNYRILSNQLKSDGIATAKQIDKSDGQPYTNGLDEIFRVFEYVPNTTPKPESDLTLYSAGLLLGKVHNSLSKLDYKPSNTIPGFHDAIYYVQQITEMASRYPAKFAQVQAEAQYISTSLQDSAYFLSEPKQLIHGDPKLQNFLFENDNAIMLVDWDACMHTSAGIDLGDALRSLCRTTNNEYDPRREKIFLRGYSTGNLNFDINDTNRIKKAASGQIIEASARYFIDFFEGNYFSYSPCVNPREENLSRARKGIQYHLSFKRETEGK